MTNQEKLTNGLKELNNLMTDVIGLTTELEELMKEDPTIEPREALIILLRIGFAFESFKTYLEGEDK